MILTKRRAIALAMLLLGCGGAQVLCGDGTIRTGNSCVGQPALTCGAGSSLQDGACVADNVVTCAAGTHLEDTGCVVDANACAAGTELKQGHCIVTEPKMPTRWLPSVRICDDGEGCQDNVLLSNGTGTVVIVYAAHRGADFAIGVSVSTDNGTTFHRAARLAGFNSGYPLAASATLDDSGRLSIVYTDYFTDGSASMVFLSSTDLGMTWSTPLVVTPTGDNALNYEPLLTQSADTFDLLYVHGEDSALMVTRSTDRGLTWSAPSDVTLTGTVLVESPAVQLGNGDLLVPYQSTVQDSFSGQISSAAGVATVTLNPQGVATVDQALDMEDIHYTSAVPVIAHVVVAANGAGQRCVAFSNQLALDYDVLVATSAAPFTASTKPKAIEAPGGTSQVEASVAVDDSGQCHLAWLDNRNSDGWAMYSAVVALDGSVSSVEKISDTPAIEDNAYLQVPYTKLIVTHGSRYAAWDDQRGENSNIYFSRGPLTAQ